MADIVQQQISDLSLHEQNNDNQPSSNIAPSTDNYVNITTDFFKITSKIQFGDVIKSNAFKLIEGTHALEVLNPKLDTSLIDLVEFDLSSSRDINEINWIFKKLLECLCSWLDNNSLSVSVLSCSYIEKLLLNYNKFGKNNLSFDEKSTEQKSLQGIIDTDDNVLVNVVLRSFCVGLLQFVKFILKLGLSGVIYEEEDLNTQTMDLDFLTDVRIEETLNDLQISIDWLNKQDVQNEGYSSCLKMIKIIKLSLRIPSLLELNLDLFTKYDLDFSYIDDSLTLLDEFRDSHYLNNLLPVPNCFTRNVQKTLNNRTPPKPLSIMSFNDSINNLIKMFTDLKFMVQMFELNDVMEFLEFINIFMQKRQFTTDVDEIVGNHVIIRSLMQLFLIRDDRSIIGSSKMYIAELMFDLLCKISLQNSKLLSLDNLENPETINLNLQKVLAQMEAPFYNFLTSISQNPSRQRQFINKELILWDTLQVECENFELTINHQLNDYFTDTELPVMSLSSFVFYFKLLKMIEFLFKSIELDLYKDIRELNVGYWFVSYLIDYLIQHVNRLIDVNKLRQSQISNYPKKIKKAKGDKKARLKLEYESKKNYLSQFIKMESYFNYHLTKLQLFKKIIELKLTTFQILNYFGYLKLPKLSKASEELLFDLQLKSYQSIGIPQLPAFKDYQITLTKFNDAFEHLYKTKNYMFFSNMIKQRQEELLIGFKRLNEILTNDLKYPEFLLSHINKDLTSLKKSSLSACLTLSQLIKLLESSNEQNLNVSIEKLNCHLWFPQIKIEKST